VLGEFDAVLADAGITAVQTPPPCPQANCFAERFVLTVRRELTDRMLILDQRHLRAMLTEYPAHYNTRRDHTAPAIYSRHLLSTLQPASMTDGSSGGSSSAASSNDYHHAA
jgi:transposase InsO family protein